MKACYIFEVIAFWKDQFMMKLNIFAERKKFYMVPMQLPSVETLTFIDTGLKVVKLHSRKHAFILKIQHETTAARVKN